MRPSEQWVVAAVIFACALAMLAWYLRTPDGPCDENGDPVESDAPACLTLLPYVPDGPVDAPTTRFLSVDQVSNRALTAWESLPEFIRLKLERAGVEMQVVPGYSPDHGVRACYVIPTRTILLYYPMLCSTTDADIANVVWHEAGHAAGLGHEVIGKYGI